MKKLLAILALFAVSVHAATLLPIQLLNPAGSTSGQAIVSSGPSSAPIWGAPSIPASSTITTPNIVGGAGAAAAVGSIGQAITPAAPTAIPITTGIALNLTSISLSPGVWLVMGGAHFVPAGTTVPTLYQGGISTTSATFGAMGTFFQNVPAATAGAFGTYPVGPIVMPITSTTTVFMVGLAAFTTSTMTATGWLFAVRIN